MARERERERSGCKTRSSRQRTGSNDTIALAAAAAAAAAANGLHIITRTQTACRRPPIMAPSLAPRGRTTATEAAGAQADARRRDDVASSGQGRRGARPGRLRALARTWITICLLCALGARRGEAAALCEGGTSPTKDRRCWQTRGWHPSATTHGQRPPPTHIKHYAACRVARTIARLRALRKANEIPCLRAQQRRAQRRAIPTSAHGRGRGAGGGCPNQPHRRRPSFFALIATKPVRWPKPARSRSCFPLLCGCLIVDVPGSLARHPHVLAFSPLCVRPPARVLRPAAGRLRASCDGPRRRDGALVASQRRRRRWRFFRL